jgi:hypothetical protein
VLFHRSLPAALVLAVTATLAAPTLASADSGSDAQFVSDTNAARSQHGLHAYSVASDLTSIANRWAAHMAANRTLEHNPNASGQVCCWQAMGENVGVGGSVSEIQQAFMGSSPHRANILSSTYAEIGVGTARGSDGRLYVDELFRLRYGATAPRATTSTSRPATHTRTYTYAAPRASRSAARAPLRPARIGVVHLSALHPSTLHPSTLHLNPVTRAMHVATFLRQVRQRLPGRVRADAVGGAFGYVQVMNAALGH